MSPQDGSSGSQGGAGEPTLHAIVLAAGGASRFGSPKQLVRIDGRPMLHSVLSKAAEVAGTSVSVVLGAYARELAPLLSHSTASLVINRNWESGMASSIRAGVASLPGMTDGVLILLADQPAITSEDLRRLLLAWRRQPEQIAAALYSGMAGVPAIFPRSCFTELSQLRGDRGAQMLLKRHTDRVTRVPMMSAATDIDTPEDLLLVEAAAIKRRPPLED
jgi:CTP:molybdopterin cytidylyltransferase MocA